MRLVYLSILLLASAAATAQAQSVIDNLPVTEIPAPVPAMPAAKEPAAAPAPPAAETYTVSDVSADVTSDTAAHARDKALLQAQRAAFTQLSARMGLGEDAAKIDDDTLAALVQSFEVQSERLSAVRYIGVFTIHFKPAALQKRFAKAAFAGDDKVALGPLTHISAAVETESLAAWAQVKRRLAAVPQISQVDTLDLGRGISHISIAYSGSVDALRDAMTTQGLILRPSPVEGWQIYDGSMVPR